MTDKSQAYLPTGIGLYRGDNLELIRNQPSEQRPKTRVNQDKK